MTTTARTDAAAQSGDPDIRPAEPLGPATAGAPSGPTPADLSVWDQLQIPHDVQKAAQTVNQVVGAISTAVGWVGTVQSALQLVGFLRPAPNPFDTLYERLQRDLRTLLTATLAGATEERLRDVAEQGALARTSAQHANEHLLNGRPTDPFATQRLAIADANSLQVMNVLSDPAWWLRTYDPSQAAVYGAPIPGPTVIGHSDLWPVSTWAQPPSAGLIWDYRHILPVYLRAMAARIVVLKARAIDGNQFQAIAGAELRGYVEFLRAQHDRINAAIRVTPAPPPHQGQFPPFVFSCGAVETYTGTHVWGGLHPMYVDPDKPLPTYEAHVAVWNQVVEDCRTRLYRAIGLENLMIVIRSVEALLVPPCGVSTATVASASAADIRCVGVEPSSHVFVGGGDGNLHLAWKSGVDAPWRWHNAGRPPGSNVDLMYYPAVTGFGTGNGRRIYGFVPAMNRSMYVYYWDGARWAWANQGGPTVQAWSCTATSFARDGRDNIRAYRSGSTGPVTCNWWDGTRWQWVDLGMPPTGGQPLVGAPAVVTYRWNGKQLDDLYLISANGQLYEHAWYEDGTRSWSRPSAQPAQPGLVGMPAVVSYERDGQPIVQVFAASAGRLACLEWRGGWGWREHGLPPGATGLANVGRTVLATALRLPSGQLWQVAVVVTAAGRVAARIRINDNDWYWQDLRTPPGTMVRDLLGINAWVKNGGFVGIDIFAGSADRRIWRTGIGFDNTWDDLGVPA